MPFRQQSAVTDVIICRNFVLLQLFSSKAKDGTQIQPSPVSLPLTLSLPSLLFPTEILITQNPPKLRKVSLKVLDRVGRKGEISGAGAQMKTFLRIFHETAKMSKQHLAE